MSTPKELLNSRSETKEQSAFLGKGHLLATLENEFSLVYGQVPFAARGDIDDLVGLIRRGG